MKTYFERNLRIIESFKIFVTIKKEQIFNSWNSSIIQNFRTKY